MAKNNEFLKSATVDELRALEKQVADELRLRTSVITSPADLITFTDGASRGNPGLAGAGVLILNGKEEKIREEFQFLGVCTNNEAEYRALLLALTLAEKITKGTVCCYLDSQLTVRQLNGEYALKSEKLAVFFHQVKNQMRHFASVTFHHVPREHPNLQLADKLANKAIDTKKGEVHG